MTSSARSCRHEGEHEMTLLDRDVVVVNQKAKLIEITNQYDLQDPEG